MKNCDLQPNGDVLLNLDKVCIETAAKRARSELVSVCLEGDDASLLSLEEPIELLRRFLKMTDFRELRSQRPELAGGRPCRVRLCRGDDGQVQWELVRRS